VVHHQPADEQRRQSEIDQVLVGGKQGDRDRGHDPNREHHSEYAGHVSEHVPAHNPALELRVHQRPR